MNSTAENEEAHPQPDVPAFTNPDPFADAQAGNDNRSRGNTELSSTSNTQLAEEPDPKGPGTAAETEARASITTTSPRGLETKEPGTAGRPDLRTSNSSTKSTDDNARKESGNALSRESTLTPSARNKSEDTTALSDKLETAKNNAMDKLQTATNDAVDMLDKVTDDAVGQLETITDHAVDTIKSKAKSAAQKIHFDKIKTSGISKAFNPTGVHVHVKFRGDSEVEADQQSEKSSAKEVELHWRSRDHRKGRHSISVPISRTSSTGSGHGHHPPPSRRTRFLFISKNIGTTLLTMLTTFPYWDMAFWSGWAYTIGSALFVIDGGFSWVPVAFPGHEFHGESKYGGPLTFFFGAIFYQIGAVVAYLEAVNDGSFHGSAMRKLMDGHDEEQKKMMDEKLHSFFGRLVPKSSDQPESVSESPQTDVNRRGGIDFGGDEEDTSPYIKWHWWPTWHALRTYHIYDIAYIACTIQLFGVTLYGVTAVVNFPTIIDSLSDGQLLAAYWIPQMVAAACFLIASIMFTLETQDEWYKPNWGSIGWWIGIWSTIGSVGFELCGAFGPAAANHHWALYQSDLSSMWGSAAYLVGSILQWYEAVNKNPEATLPSMLGG